jgi:uncharacterized cupredoxin-like copper-binding protein
MKRFLIVLIALLTMAAFVSVSDAKTKKPKALKAKGEVTAYETGKTITIQPAKGDPMTFEVDPKAVVKGEVAEKAKVTVTYKKEGETMTATAIQVAPAKAPAKKKK